MPTTAAFYSTDTLNSRLDQVGRILALMRQVGEMDNRMRITMQSMLCNTAANLIEGNADVTNQDPFLNISFRAQELGYRISNSEAQSLGRKVAKHARNNRGWQPSDFKYKHEIVQGHDVMAKAYRLSDYEGWIDSIIHGFCRGRNT